jgi:hypothetical protein
VDNKLTWKDHIIKKRKQMDLRRKELYWLLGMKSHVSVDNKLLLYKSIITPIWTYGIELWGCACKSNIAVIQKCQSKILRAILSVVFPSMLIITQLLFQQNVLVFIKSTRYYNLYFCLCILSPCMFQPAWAIFRGAMSVSS